MKTKKGLSIVILLLLSSTMAVAQTVFRGVIIDAQTKQPIINAKVGISDQGVGEFTDINGKFAYRKYHRVVNDESALIIGANGYETIHIPFQELRSLFNISSIMMLEPTSQVEEDVQIKSVTIFWDISENMKSRDSKLTLDSIEQFIKERTIEEIELVAFNYKIQKEETFEVEEGWLSRFRESVMALNYNGPSNYAPLEIPDTDAIILSSNGDANYGELQVSQDVPIYMFATSKKNLNELYLQKLAKYTSGKYVALYQDKPLSKQKNNSQQIGVVTSLGKPLQGVSIVNKGSFTEYFTQSNGGFNIPVNQGDVLQFRYLGMFPKDVVIKNTSNIEVEMLPENDVLDEVIVTKKKEKFISGNKEIIGWRVPYSVGGVTNRGDFYITSKDITPDAKTLEMVIKDFFKGATIVQNPWSGPVLTIKGRKLTYVVDDVVIRPDEPPPFYISDSDIESIIVRYPKLIIITTKNNSFVKEKKAHRSIARGNDYIDLFTKEIDTTLILEHLSLLQDIPNVEDKFKAYQHISKVNELTLEYYIDMSNYFESLDSDLADKVRTDIAYISSNNTKALRILAYMYEKVRDYNKALLIYERIVKIAPFEAQSYRDLALMYKETGKYNQALELYINMLGGHIKGANFRGIEKLLSNELKHLISLHKDKIDFERLTNDWLQIDYNIDIRMVIDWSDRTAPFEFQFVNPDKKFVKWTHTLVDNRDLLKEEQSQGFQTREFIIDDARPGEWLINIQYLGDEKNYILPPFLKYTVYRNYGSPQETKEIKIVKLFKQSNKVTLGKIAL